MSQVVNTYWVNRVNSSARAGAARKQASLLRPIDGVVIMVILAAMALCTSVYWRTGAELTEAEQKHLAATEKVEQLKLETGRLEAQVQRLRNDPRMIESVARQNLGFVRAGEMVIKVEPNSREAIAKNLNN